ncbi:MAG: hypothetical protein J1F66_04615 [Clostridiales bacterium]|nr:hypothetical protein [Clostridiales bacterium]
MKIIKKLSKWQTWVFVILSFLMLFACLGIAIYGAVVKSFNVSLIVSFEILFMMAVILFYCNTISQLIRRKVGWRVVVTILLVVCFLGLRVTYTAMYPKYLNICMEYETLYEEWKDIPYENRDEFWDKFDALQEVGGSRTELRFTVNFLHLGSLGALLFARFCEGVKNEKSGKEEVE